MLPNLDGWNVRTSASNEPENRSYVNKLYLRIDDLFPITILTQNGWFLFGQLKIVDMVGTETKLRNSMRTVTMRQVLVYGLLICVCSV